MHLLPRVQQCQSTDLRLTVKTILSVKKSGSNKRHARNEQPCRYLFELLFPIQPKPFGLRWKMVLWDHVVVRSVSTTCFTTRSRRFIEKRAPRTHPAVLKWQRRQSTGNASHNKNAAHFHDLFGSPYCWLLDWKGIWPIKSVFNSSKMYSLRRPLGTRPDVVWPWKSGSVW